MKSLQKRRLVNRKSLQICGLVNLLALAGCATTTPTIQVKVPVPVECAEAMPGRPSMPTEGFTARPALDAFVRSAQAEIERREGYELQLRTALENCKAPIRP